MNCRGMVLAITAVGSKEDSVTLLTLREGIFPKPKLVLGIVAQFSGVTILVAQLLLAGTVHGTSNAKPFCEEIATGNLSLWSEIVQFRV